MLLANQKLGRDAGIALWLTRPMRRVVGFTTRFGDRLSYFLSLPRILFQMHYQEGSDKRRKNRFSLTKLQCGFVTQKKITSLTKIYSFPFPNFLADFSVCLGMENKTVVGNNVEELMVNSIGRFWSVRFESDNYLQLNARSIFGDYHDWELKTLQYPTWVPNHKYFSVYYTFESFSYFTAKELSHVG